MLFYELYENKKFGGHDEIMFYIWLLFFHEILQTVLILYQLNQSSLILVNTSKIYLLQRLAIIENREINN